jgi:hypothetical protein
LSQSLRTDDRDGDGDEEYLSGHDMLVREAETLPKIDEATGVRPPSRRGRPSTRANQTLLRSHLGRPFTGNVMGGAAEETSPISGEEAGRELFSDCTTPDAPEEGDAVVRLCVCVLCACVYAYTNTHYIHAYTYIQPSLSPGRYAGRTEPLNGKGVPGGGTPVRPSVVSERMLVHNDDELDSGEESDDHQEMPRRARNLIGMYMIGMYMYTTRVRTHTNTHTHTHTNAHTQTLIFNLCKQICTASAWL